MPMTFEQQPKESNKAFAAFKTYLELGAERSLAVTGEKLGKSTRMMEKWSRKFDWPARVQAHAAHLADIERTSAEAVAVKNGVDWAARQQEHREDEWQTRGELIALAREAIERWKKNSARCGTLEGIARLLDLASKLGRVSSGLSLEPEDKPEEVDDGALLIQINLAIEKIYGQPEAGRNVSETKIVEVEAASEVVK
ncbi:MAG: hypothetical protein QM813_01305 [Verrucomicrobiota bacterium]